MKEPLGRQDQTSLQITTADWTAIFEVVDQLRRPDDGGCIILARVLAGIFQKRGIDIQRMVIASVRYPGNQIEHAWLVVDNQPIHAPYSLSPTELAWMEANSETDKQLTAQLHSELSR